MKEHPKLSVAACSKVLKTEDQEALRMVPTDMISKRRPNKGSQVSLDR